MSCDSPNDLVKQPVQPVKTGRFPYGWRAVAVFAKDGSKLVGKYRKEFSHSPRTILLGAPRRGGLYVTLAPSNERQTKRCNECKPTRYIVWHDRSLRRVDNLLRAELEGMTTADQNEMLRQVAA